MKDSPTIIVYQSRNFTMAYYHERRRGFAVQVCSTCRENDPGDEELMRVYCRAYSRHNGAPAALVTWSEKKWTLVEIRPFPNTTLAHGRYVKCAGGKVCRGDRCTYAHSDEELIVWNTILEEKRAQGDPRFKPQATGRASWRSTVPVPRSTAPATAKYGRPVVQPQVFKGPQSQNRHTPPGGHGGGHGFGSRSDMKSSYRERSKNPPSVEDAKVDLTQRTYQSKFYSLLHWEEERHIDLLSQRCEGDYHIIVYQRGDVPPWVRNGDPSSRFGCISGMTGDQIMYASQASECVFIVDQSGGQKIDVCAGEILQENMNGHYDEMLVEFTDEEADKLERHYKLGAALCNKRVRVDFEVKHLYFDLLHKSLKGLSFPQIGKVVPTPGGRINVLPVFRNLQHPTSYEFLGLDKQSQLPALEKVVSSSAQYPVLISGAFGTGKTRLLAVAAYHLIEEGKQRGTPTRVLLCCHHQITADAFIEEYFGKMVHHQTDPWKVKLARLTRLRYSFKSSYPHLYSNNDKFKKMFSWEYAREDYVVVVTTFLTALSVKQTIGSNFFTHILLDEAAQVREPEAVGPLCMANQNTKIVIAGDDRQVGPGILVLGDIARDNGLAKSLFTRLLEFYNQHQLYAPVAVLNTNYRCHRTIVSLARSLFYSQDLQSCANPTSIPGVDHPIWFVCSSLDKTLQKDVDTNQDEARALIDQLKLFFGEPRMMDDVCIMATNRNQLSDIKIGLKKQKRSTIPAQFVPTYLIQGGEFKALFMSTVESLDPSGCSYNPTKSLCSPSVFNTAITRAKSLIVAVGNPYTLMTVEENMDTNKQCWAEYLSRCFKTNTVVARSGISDAALRELRRFVDQRVQLPPTPVEQSITLMTPAKQTTQSVTSSNLQEKRTEEKAALAYVQNKLPSAPDKVSSLAQIHANNLAHITATPVQNQQAVVSVAAAPAKEKPGPFMVCTFAPTGRDIYVELSLHGATSQNTTIKTTGPFPDRSQALSNPLSMPAAVVEPNITKIGDNACIVRLPPLHQPGVFAVMVSSNSSRGMFLLNVFDPDAVKLRGQVTCKVGQVQQWVADCRRAGPGVLAASINGTNIPVEYSPNGLHTIAFMPVNAGLYTLEVTYNGHDTGNTQEFNVQ